MTKRTPDPLPGPPRLALALFSLAVFLSGHGCRATPPPLVVEEGRVELYSSHPGLAEGFAWAKAQALAYAFQGDPVGKWYEAALPGREAFCMRDVSHQATGAMALGLREHTKNMFWRFAVSIAPSRDWAGYWEIDRRGEPAPVDYRNDQDFWYNLPANFDLIQAMHRVFEWTGDPEYLENPDFLAFYHHSLTDYVQAWDPDGDGIMESPPENGIRGIPTYWEGGGPRAATGADLLGAQFAANRAYGAILRLRGRADLAEPFEREAERLQQIYNEAWWNPEAGRFYTAILPGGGFDDSFLPLGQLYPLYFGIVEEGPARERMIEELPDGGSVELDAYLPEVLFRNGEYERAFDALLAQMDPALARREYPEVSFTAVGHVVADLMGVRPRASEGVIETKSRLTNDVKWIHLRYLHALSNEISLRHDGAWLSTLRNDRGGTLRWRAVFPGTHRTLLVDGKERAASLRNAPGEGPESWVEVNVGPGEEVVVRGEERG